MVVGKPNGLIMDLLAKGSGITKNRLCVVRDAPTNSSMVLSNMDAALC